jgi:hypothetical protein
VHRRYILITRWGMYQQHGGGLQMVVLPSGFSGCVRDCLHQHAVVATTPRRCIACCQTVVRQFGWPSRPNASRMDVYRNEAVLFVLRWHFYGRTASMPSIAPRIPSPSPPTRTRESTHGKVHRRDRSTVPSVRPFRPNPSSSVLGTTRR